MYQNYSESPTERNCERSHMGKWWQDIHHLIKSNITWYNFSDIATSYQLFLITWWRRSSCTIVFHQRDWSWLETITVTSNSSHIHHCAQFFDVIPKNQNPYLTRCQHTISIWQIVLIMYQYETHNLSTITNHWHYDSDPRMALLFVIFHLSASLYLDIFSQSIAPFQPIEILVQ